MVTMRPLLLAAFVSLFLLGCPENGNPNTTDPPQVFLTIPDTNAYGDRLSVIVNQVGCKTVKTATLRHSGNVIKTFAYSASPTPVDLLVTDIPWSTVKLSAHLVLSVEITCDDGRHNTSQEKGAQFFPVAEVISPNFGGSVVSSIFYAEGSGDTVTFVGCETLAGGGTGLIRVDRTGATVKENQHISVPCDNASVFSEKTVDGTRWMWKPNVGAMAFDANLDQTSLAQWNNPAVGIVTLQPLGLAVGPDGDAMITVLGDVNVGGEGGADLWRIAHKPGCTQCATDFWAVTQPGALSDPVVAGGWVYQVVRSDASTGIDADVQTCRTPYVNTGANTIQPKCFPLFHLHRVTGDPWPDINALVQPDGAFSYATYNSASDGQFTVDASLTTTFNKPYWAANPVLTGKYGTVYPIQNNEVIAAVGQNNVYFLDQKTGSVLNPGGTPISPAGGLHSFFVTGTQTGSDFFLETAPTNSVLPTEVVGVDAPGNGELFRFRVGDTSSLFLTQDDAGTAWMRIGTKLVRLYTLAQYRSLLNGGSL